jgi:hypothetical protein
MTTTARWNPGWSSWAVALFIGFLYLACHDGGCFD